MVMRTLYLLLLCPFFVFSGEFVATVDRNEVYMGESLTLSLTLKEVSPRGMPTAGRLKKSFKVNSEQQSSNTVVVNGRITSSTSWQFVLTPISEGDHTIPSISVHTSDGTFASDPITIHVMQGISSKSADVSDIEGVSFTSEVSNASPYKNEQVSYTARLTLKRNVANIQMQKLNMEDAIVELSGEPKVFEQVVNGIRADVIEFNYLITPLKSGPLEIPSAVVEGGIPVKRRPNAGSLFDQDFDPISMMQGFNHLKPFQLSTDPISLEVQPPVPGLEPWLPARSLFIEESFDSSQTLQVGNPMMRTITIRAEGVKASQLPDLTQLQSDDGTFKVYADNPQLKDEMKSSRIQSLRQQDYTLVPQIEGLVTLPEISVRWWDVVAKKKRITTLPARSLQIAPAISPQEIAITASIPEVSTPVVVEKNNTFLYVIIGSLGSLLLVAIVFGIWLLRKMNLMKQPPCVQEVKAQNGPVNPPIFDEEPKEPTAKEKKESLPDLNPT